MFTPEIQMFATAAAGVVGVLAVLLVFRLLDGRSDREEETES